jgi:hypothetical protein
MKDGNVRIDHREAAPVSVVVSGCLFCLDDAPHDLVVSPGRPRSFGLSPRLDRPGEAVGGCEDIVGVNFGRGYGLRQLAEFEVWSRA